MAIYVTEGDSQIQTYSQLAIHKSCDAHKDIHLAGKVLQAHPSQKYLAHNNPNLVAT